MPALAEYNRLAAKWDLRPSEEVLERARALLSAAELEYPGATLRIASWADPLGAVEASTLAGEIVCPRRLAPISPERLQSERRALEEEAELLVNLVNYGPSEYARLPPGVRLEEIGREDYDSWQERIEDIFQTMRDMDEYARVTEEIERLGEAKFWGGGTSVSFPEGPEAARDRIRQLGEVERVRDTLTRRITPERDDARPAALVGLAARLVEQPELLDRTYEAAQLLELALLSSSQALASAADAAGVETAAVEYIQNLENADDAMGRRGSSSSAASPFASAVEPVSNRERLFSVLAAVAGRELPSPYGDAAHAKLASATALNEELALLAAQNLLP